MTQRMERGPKHHSCRKGTLVRVELRDGTVIQGRFKEKSRRFCLLEPDARIPWRKVRKFNIVPKLVAEYPKTGPARP